MPSSFCCWSSSPGDSCWADMITIRRGRLAVTTRLTPASTMTGRRAARASSRGCRRSGTRPKSRGCRGTRCRSPTRRFSWSLTRRSPMRPPRSPAASRRRTATGRPWRTRTRPRCSAGSRRDTRPCCSRPNSPAAMREETPTGRTPSPTPWVSSWTRCHSPPDGPSSPRSSRRGTRKGLSACTAPHRAASGRHCPPALRFLGTTPGRWCWRGRRAKGGCSSSPTALSRPTRTLGSRRMRASSPICCPTTRRRGQSC